MATNTSIDLEVKITVTANDHDLFDLTCTAHPEFNRENVPMDSLPQEAASVMAEVGNRIARDSIK